MVLAADLPVVKAEANGAPREVNLVTQFCGGQNLITVKVNADCEGSILG